MKKVINLVSLVVFVSINVFTPFSYAQEDTNNISTLDTPDITYYNVAGEERAIMAYNLGATSTDIDNEDSYGDKYSWGVNEQCNGSYNHYHYGSCLDNYWENYNAGEYRWDEGAQGLCPAGYHVPTMNEWVNLFVQWCENDKQCDTKKLHYNYNYGELRDPDFNSSFLYEFYLPTLQYHSSTPVQHDVIWSFSTSNYIGDYRNEEEGPIVARAIRCFKDSEKSDPIPLALDIYNDGNLVDRIFVPADQTLPQSKIDKLSKYTLYDEDDNEINLDTVIFTEDDSNDGVIVLNAGCAQGYHEVNGRCIPENVGIFYEDGYVKITDGSGTIYIKDRNQGAEISLKELYDKYGAGENIDIGVDEDYSKTFGKFYFWGNNTGANRNQIIIDDFTDLYVGEEFYNQGFSRGYLGEPEGNGWIEGSADSPCNGELGEYLPTISDYKNAIGIWSNIKGYQNNYLDFLQNGYLNVFPEFFDDILVPYIPVRNENSFDNIIYAGIFYDGRNFWTSMDEQHNAGYIDGTSLEVANYDYQNNEARNVRCFVHPVEIPDVYVVKFETNGGEVIAEVEVIGGNTVSLPTPSRVNYIFTGWYTDELLTTVFDSSLPVTSDLILYAKREKQPEPDNSSVEPTQPSKPTNGYSGGGGRLKVTKPDTNKNDHGSAETPKSEATAPIEGGEKNESSDGTKGSTFSKPAGAGSNKVVLDMESYNPSYSFEQNQAYQFAKSYGITTKSTIQDANVNGNLTRIQMAKMLSQYSVNVLGKEPDLSNGTVKFADVPQSLDKKYDNGVSVAYLLGIMGQNMKDNRFRPYDEVTRGEFVTAFSRMIYNTSDEKYKSTAEYYTNHMNKLSLEKIITKIDPKMKELRGYVMLMLYRSVK